MAKRPQTCAFSAVVKLAGGDQRWLDIVRPLLAQLFAAARSAIFAAKARRIYLLHDSVSP